MRLPKLGELKYNGYDFGADTETTHCSVFPQYDAAGRTVTGNLFTFTFRTTLAGKYQGGGPDAERSTADEALAARRALSKPGGHFVYKGRGFCELEVNPPASAGATGPAPGARDSAWGPKPRSVSFRPLGRAGACELTWTIETTVPDCADAVYALQAMEFSYTASFDRTADGRTLRTLAGYLRVPATRRSIDSRAIPDLADRYRAMVVAPLPVGFRRTFQPFRSDAAKTRLDFGYTDEEMPGNAPPPGITDCQASHTTNSSAAGLMKWQGSIQATYTLDLLTDPTVAIKAFFALVKKRLAALKGAKDDQASALGYSQGLANLAGFGNSGTKFAPAKSIIPVSFMASEPAIYGVRQVVLSMGYTYVGSVGQALAGGLWQPVPRPAGNKPEQAWLDWSASLAGTQLHPYGGARMRLQSTDDALIDLCKSGPSVPDQFAGFDAQLDSLATDPPPGNETVMTAGTMGSLADAFPPPPPDQSYLYYECELFVESDSGVAVVRPLPARQLTRTDELFGSADDFAGRGQFDALRPGDGPGFANPAGGGTSPPPPPPPAPAVEGGRVVRRAKGSVYVYLCGRAGRVGFRPEIPRLVAVGNQTPVPANRLDRGEGYGVGVKFAAGAPVYTARWMLRYSLPDVPDTLPTPPNPFLGTDGAPPQAPPPVPPPPPGGP